MRIRKLDKFVRFGQKTTKEFSIMAEESKKTHVTLAFKHPLTDEELQKLKLTTDALEIFQVHGGHHHDHDSIISPHPPVGDPAVRE
jgi:hypothetical protein